jgi:sugar phosphate isomerase/epimerase
MQIGAMNHPQHDPLEEMRWMSEMGLDFVDLTLEPPRAASWLVDPRKIAEALRRYELGVVGHTAYYLPIASPFEEIRRAAVAELKRCMQIFAAVGAKWMNVHPDRYAPLHDRKFYIERDVLSLRELTESSKALGVGLMIENLPGDFNNVAQLGDLMEPLPDLGLHLDIGHANLLNTTNMTDDILRAYGKRLRHVHLHDNKGGSADLHLPLGAGTVNVARHVRTLKASGYDGKITLEVFCEDQRYLAYSRDLLRRMWDGSPLEIAK